MSKLPIPFSNPATYPGHSGVDYAQPRGTVFRASGPGYVVALGRNLRGGFYIWVRYDTGALVGYHHMDSHAGCPPVRSRVQEGTPLGYIGNTGNSTGPHLHSEVSGHATTVGYWKFFNRTTVVTASGATTTPTQPPAVTVPPESEEEDDMKYLYVDDDGNGKPIFVLINTRTSRFITTKNQEQANTWAAVWGNAIPTTRNAFLTALDAIQKTA